MRTKKYYLLFLALILFLNCYADSSEEIIMPIEGLEIVTLENIRTINKFKIIISPYCNSISMGKYEGLEFGGSINMNNLYSILCSYYFINNQELHDWYEEGLSNYSIAIAKDVQFGQYFHFVIAHAFNYIEYYYDLFSYYNDFYGSDTLFEPSLNIIYGINFNLILQLNLYCMVENIYWYTNPKYKKEGYKCKVSDVYDKPQYKFGFTYKF